MASKSIEELRSAAVVKTLSKRSSVALCMHGINKSYCIACANKKPAKSTRSKKAAATEPSAPAAE